MCHCEMCGNVGADVVQDIRDGNGNSYCLSCKPDRFTLDMDTVSMSEYEYESLMIEQDGF